MQFSIALPTDRVDAPQEFLTASAIGRAARAVEDAGLHACFASDHPFPSALFIANGGLHAGDPFVALACAAAATRRVRLHLNLLVLPYRNPFMAAKQCLSLDVASDGRLIVGAAAGFLKAEFSALGADFESRAETTTTAIEAMKHAWTEPSVTFTGKGFDARDNVMEPRPASRPHPPIWMGGNSRRAIRMAVEHCQGWIPFETRPGVARAAKSGSITCARDLATHLEFVREHALAVNRSEPLEFAFALAPFFDGEGLARDDYEPLRAGLAEFTGVGLSWLSVHLPNRPTLDGYVREVERFARCVL